MLSKLFNGKNGTEKSATNETRLLTAWNKVLVPAVAAPFSMRSVNAACRLCQDANASELRFVYVIEVPRSVALKASMPVEDGMAEDALGAAVSAAMNYGIRAHTEVLHVREATDGIAKYVSQTGSDLLVLGSRADALRGLSLSLCRDLYQKVSCEVILNYIGAEAEEQLQLND